MDHLLGLQHLLHLRFQIYFGCINNTIDGVHVGFLLAAYSNRVIIIG